MRNLLFSLLAASLVVGCSSKPKDTSVPINGVKSKATVHVRDLKRNEEQTVDLTIYTSMQKMRIEAKATMLGIPVAVLMLSQDKVEALLLREKKYVVGSSEAIFKNLLQTPIKIGLIFKIVFHPKDPYFRRRCTTINAEGHCTAKMGKATIEWQPVENEDKIFWIKTAGYEVAWEFESEDFEWEPNPAIFELKVPAQFKRDVLN